MLCIYFLLIIFFLSSSLGLLISFIDYCWRLCIIIARGEGWGWVQNGT
jgi:hypothetical protein